jgi:hypothetical protein
MTWNGIPSWLKGGIILLTINIVLILLYFVITGGVSSYDSSASLMYLPSFLVTDGLYWGSNSSMAVFIFSSIFYFIIGVIIGGIIGKVKRHKF